MTKEQNIKFLVSLGVPEERAKAMSKAIPDGTAETPETEIEEAFQSVSTNQSDLFKNGDDYKKALKEKYDQALREVMTKSEKKIAQIAGLTADEVKDKKFDDIVDLAWKKASKNSDKSLEDLQAELRSRDEQLRVLNEETIPGIRSEIDKEKLSMKTRTSMMAEIAKLKLKAGIDQEDAIVLFETKAKAKGFKVSYTDKGEMILVNQDDSKIMSEDKRTLLKTGEIFGSLLDGLIEKSGAPDKKDPIVIKEDKEDKDKGGKQQGRVVSANLSKAEAHVKHLQEQSKK